jgi:hypothetical protein
MSGLHILFWNMYRKDLSEALASIVEEHEPSVVILAECGATVEVLLDAVNRETVRYRFVDMIGDSKLVALTTLSSIQIHCLRDERRYSFWRVQTEHSVVTLCGVHLQSALNYDRDELNELTRRLRQDLESVEVFEKHNRTILIGDFNLDPFDQGLTSSEGLGSVSSLRLAQRSPYRKVAFETRRVLYNPMWSHLGDRPSEPEGTYFRPSGIIGYGWRMFDQILFGSSVMELFRDFEVEILRTAGDNDLVDHRGLPDSTSASDHLPIRIHFLEKSLP